MNTTKSNKELHDILGNVISSWNAATSTIEPQTVAYQVAMDNIDNDMSLNAIAIMGSWFLRSGNQWNDRLDYVSDLEHRMELALGKRTLGYHLDI